MINKQFTQEGKFTRLPLIQYILIHKHSQQPRLNYEYRKFSQFLKPIQQEQSPYLSQIQCRDFLCYYSHNQILSHYYNFSAIFQTIRGTVLKRVNEDYVFPIHFPNESFCNKLKRFVQKKKTLLNYKERNEQLSGEGKNKQNLKMKGPLTAITPVKNQIRFPGIKRRILSQSSSETSDYSIKILEKVTKDLSVLIKEMNQDQLEKSLSGYISNLKSSIKLRKSEREEEKKEQNDELSPHNLRKEKIFFRKPSKFISKESEKVNKQVNQKDYNILRKQEERQTYGLKTSRRSHDKKLYPVKGKTETVRKKLKDKQITIKVSPQTPKPHKQRCLYIREFSPESESKKSIFSKTKVKTKTRTKIKVKSTSHEYRGYISAKSLSKKGVKQKGKEVVKNFY